MFLHSVLQLMLCSVFFFFVSFLSLSSCHSLHLVSWTIASKLLRLLAKVVLATGATCYL